VTSTAHEGLRKSITATSNDVTWQRCYVRFKRCVFDKVSKSDQPLFRRALTNTFHQTSFEASTEALNRAVDLLSQKHRSAAEWLLAAQGVALRRYFSAESMRPLELDHAEEQPAHPNKEAGLPKAA
jgi:transposase-like protein